MDDMDQSLVHDVGDNPNEYFRFLHSRTLNTLNTNYLLPVDHDEVKRSEYHHRLVQFLFSGRNWVGPVKEALQFGQHRRVLDLGTGSGLWAIDTADEFTRAEVIAIDLAPIQPEHVPPNCTFELCDLDEAPIPYPDSFFDFIHARSLHIGIRNYPRLLREVARLLRPGGLVLLIEPTLHPCPAPAGKPPMHGWITLWDTYRKCLRRQNIDVTVPERLSELLSEAGAFESVIIREGNVPVGFWPKDPHSLSIGQLQWMDYDLLLPALRPLFLCSGLPPSSVDLLIKDAQNDLYNPPYDPSTRLHIAYATKRFTAP
ncbi:S-adenosyl-L-methionine-dependent methyltransferase [Crepidotus variabilis]|uniref:S-adenosyl-L-methionine-dependent methyltransferase n=1 Tax=Crepidotus variabilis TaxID=179855 RepID=A0A9P6JVD1_9AGAR|nr:S-adenosyl-L-methionine-dependent methyltransferase [Crepidotus variabilis]